MDFSIGFAIGITFGALMVFSPFNEDWQNRLIEAELAEFTVDSTTGDTTFIIYAEQPQK